VRILKFIGSEIWAVFMFVLWIFCEIFHVQDILEMTWGERFGWLIFFSIIIGMTIEINIWTTTGGSFGFANCRDIVHSMLAAALLIICLFCGYLGLVVAER